MSRYFGGFDVVYSGPPKVTIDLQKWIFTFNHLTNLSNKLYQFMRFVVNSCELYLCKSTTRMQIFAMPTRFWNRCYQHCACVCPNVLNFFGLFSFQDRSWSLYFKNSGFFCQLELCTDNLANNSEIAWFFSKGAGKYQNKMMVTIGCCRC